jgi:CheY-like chemotaxis protein
MEAKETYQTLSILVIDDDPRSCELVAAMLTEVGFEVRSAYDGASGIELARTGNPAAIIVDMMMPGMDGIHTLRRLKQDPVLRQIPAVAITAAPELRYHEQAFRTGAGYFVAKPFEAESLIHMVTLALQRIRHEADRRSDPRCAAELPVRCLIREHGQTIREVVGRTGNVCLGGTLLWLPEMLVPGAVFHMDVELLECTVSIQGTVIWQVGEAADPIMPHGVQLLDFREEADFLRYRGFLEKLAGEPTE